MPRTYVKSRQQQGQASFFRTHLNPLQLRSLSTTEAQSTENTAKTLSGRLGLSWRWTRQHTGAIYASVVCRDQGKSSEKNGSHTQSHGTKGN